MDARVAQSVERSAVNRKVGGSNPPVSDFFLFFFTLSCCGYVIKMYYTYAIINLLDACDKYKIKIFSLLQQQLLIKHILRGWSINILNN